jgi:hypothetical protein
MPKVREDTDGTSVGDEPHYQTLAI